MIEDLLIFNEAGTLLYNWHPSGKEISTDDDLFSGFLTAINTFAVFERGEDIKSLKLKETQIIFEKFEKYHQKLTFVVTTKNEEFIELLHSLIHKIMDDFTIEFSSILNREFDGEISEFQKFDKNVEDILYSHGIDVLEDSIKKIQKLGILKSIIFLEHKSGIIYYIYAKQYINKDRLSFLIPLIINSANLLYYNNLNEKLKWILLNTVRNENLLVEKRDAILIIRQYQLLENYENQYLSLDFFRAKEKYIKKPKKLEEKFESVKWDTKIKQVFLVDLLGKILFSRIFDSTYDCSNFIPETISFLTASKKTSEEIYNRTLYNASIGGERITTICLNLNNYALILIGNVEDYNNFEVIQNLCFSIFKQF